jgi:putative colanic acid biosynthesis UDP-glucose lipid carrier transferase
MTDRIYFRQSLPIGLAELLRRISAAIVAYATLRIGMLITEIGMTEAYQSLLIIVALLALILIRGSDTSELYRTPRFRNTAMSIFWGWCALFGVLLFLGYATKTSSIFSRKLLLSWSVVTPIFILIARMAIDNLIARLTRTSTSLRRAVIAGVNEYATLLGNKIEQSSRLGLSLDGYFDDRGLERLGQIRPDRLLGKLKDLPGYVRAHHIDLIYIALPMRNIQRVMELLDELHDTTASIYFIPDVFVFDLIQCRTDEIDGLPIVALCETPFYGSRGVIKRVSDFIIALAVLIMFSPLLVVIAIVVKLTTPGSVIFKQQRYGLDGREITVYKFRTMHVSEDSDTIPQAVQNDSRVTRVGRILRRYSLDELPQFVNVLQGRMSVVGPRPHAIAHNEEYRKLIKGYMIRHKVNPGVTGLAQIRGFRGETSTVNDMRQRVEADLEYLRNWSLELDVRIIFKTATMIFKDKKAY